MGKTANAINDSFDMSIFDGTVYENMPYIMESGWDNYDVQFASPVFVFDNGDRVVISKIGEIMRL